LSTEPFFRYWSGNGNPELLALVAAAEGARSTGLGAVVVGASVVGGSGAGTVVVGAGVVGGGPPNAGADGAVVVDARIARPVARCREAGWGMTPTATAAPITIRAAE
jgi:hypothetical protein